MSLVAFLFTLEDLAHILFEIGVTLGIILVVIGVCQALLWKLAFYVNLGIGLVTTLIATYITEIIGENLVKFLGISLDTNQATLVVFFSFLAITFLVAFVGAILALLQGFGLTSIGIMIATLPSTHSIVNSIALGFIGGIVVVGLAAYAGSYLDIWILNSFPKLSRAGKKGALSTSGAMKRFDLSAKERLIRARILGYVIAYKEVNLADLASRFRLKEKEVENILFEHLGEGRIQGKINPERKFILEAQFSPYESYARDQSNLKWERPKAGISCDFLLADGRCSAIHENSSARESLCANMIHDLCCYLCPQERCDIACNILESDRKNEPKTEGVGTQGSLTFARIRLTRLRILGYLITHGEASLEMLAKRYDVDERTIEEIIFELLGEGKIKGSFSSENKVFIAESIR